MPYEESFIGSNNKSYKYKYYVAVMNSRYDNINIHIQQSEISKAEWIRPDECINCIRKYSNEKKNMVECIKQLFNNYYVHGS